MKRLTLRRQWRIIALTMVGISLIIRSVAAEETTPAPADETAKRARATTLRVVDPDGEPVADAKVGDYACWEVDDAVLPEMHGFGDPREDIDPQLTDENGLCELDAETVAAAQLYGPQAAYAIAAERELVGLAELASADADGIVTITMQPWCAVDVFLDSRELTELGQPFERSKCYIYWNMIRPFFSNSTGKRLRYLLPPGKYRFDAYGSRLVDDVSEDFEILAGERNKRIEVDLPATRLAHLIGHPAPELVSIETWRYSEPLRLADLRGRIVLLEFWGTWCGPCVGSMPTLIDLYNEFHDDGLTVIAVHTALTGSEEKLDEKLATAGEKHWGGADLPFPVALDGSVGDKDSRDRFGATTAEYGIHTWPTAIMIDRAGNVVGEFNYRDRNAREELRIALGLPEAAATPPTTK